MAAEDYFDFYGLYDDEDDEREDDEPSPWYRRPQKHPHECPGKLVQRINAATGAKFIGCSRFPKCRWTQDGELPTPPKPMSHDEALFKAGWDAGYYDGGEHDFRMFTPTAERAWEDYKRRKK